MKEKKRMLPRYPWKDWFEELRSSKRNPKRITLKRAPNCSLKTGELRRNKNFRCMVHCMNVLLRRAAARYRIPLTIRMHENGMTAYLLDDDGE